MVVVAILALIVLLGLYGSETMTRTHRYAGEGTAAERGLPEPEPVMFQAVDGRSLAAWWFPSPTSDSTIVVAHGHGGDKRSSLWMAEGLFPNHSVLLMDLRGHGESDGARTSIGVLERHDVVAAVTWARHRCAGPVGVYGMSMGGAAAILAAADCPDIAAVVADSPYARLRTPIRTSICQRGYPRRLAPALARLVCGTARLRLSGRQAWPDPVDVVERIAPRPLLLIHGGADTLIPPSESEALYARAGQPKELWVEPGVPHASVATMAGPLYHARINRFFDRALERVPLAA